jgi:hypothetical protein
LFTISKDLLALHSRYFEKGFQEAEDGKPILLPGVKPAEFADFYFFIYSGDLIREIPSVAKPTTAGNLWVLGKIF